MNMHEFLGDVERFCLSFSEEEQVEVISGLAQAHADLADDVSSAIQADSGDLLHINLKGGKEEIVAAALLSIVRYEIGSVPDSRVRREYLSSQGVLYRHFNLTAGEVSFLLRHVPVFVEMFAKDAD